MTIEPVIGIQSKKTTISEKEFPSFSIFSTVQMAREYFTRYGYQFAGFYDDEKKLVIVKDNNFDLSLLTGEYNRYRVLNYRTGEVVLSSVSIVEIAQKFFPKKPMDNYSFTHEIEKIEDGMRLIKKATSEVVLEAELMLFLDQDKVLINNYGLESIFIISDNAAYPFIKPEQIVYMGNQPENFVDIRNGMFLTYQNTIQPVIISHVNLFTLVKKYPYGEKIANHFKLLNLPLRYGIFYSNEDEARTNWYPTLEDRNKVLGELGLLVEDVLEGKHVKVMKD